MSWWSHDRARRQIEAHFACACSPAGERRMRAHLIGCAICRAYYDDCLLVASLDPGAASSQERLGLALGMGGGGPRSVRTPGFARARLIWAVGGTLALATALLVVERVRPGQPAEFAARGAGNADVPALELFRIPAAGGAPESVTDTVGASDEIAFAYRNPGEKRRLMIFAVDEHGHVFWYHPAWSDPAADPRAVAISPGPGLHELPAAVAQRYDGQALTIHALFADQDLTVRQVEAALAAGVGSRASKGTEWPFQDVIDAVRAVRVMP